MSLHKGKPISITNFTVPMKVTNLLWALAFMASNVYASDTLVYRTSVFFASDESSIPQEEQNKLQEFIGKLKLHERISLEIIGHTDNVGSTDYNSALSKKRADEVEQYFKTLGLNYRVKAEVGKGEMAPITSNGTEEGKQLNRRVEVRAIVNKLESVQDLFRVAQQRQVQTFNIKTNASQEIIGSQGTRLFIPENAFVDAMGNPVSDKEVTVKLTEALTFSDMLLNGLTTMTSDGDVLETGGMFFIEATANGQTLSLAPVKEISFKLPNQNLKDDMRLFSGNTSAGNTVSWDIMPTARISNTNKPTVYFSVQDSLLKGFKTIDVSGRKTGVFKSNIPASPGFYSKPRHPVLPDTANIRYRPSGIETVLMSSKKIELRRQAIIRRQMATYDAKVAKFKKDSVKFATELCFINDKRAAEYQKQVSDLYDRSSEHFYKLLDNMVVRNYPNLVAFYNRCVEDIKSKDSLNLNDFNFEGLVANEKRNKLRFRKESVQLSVGNNFDNNLRAFLRVLAMKKGVKAQDFDFVTTLDKEGIYNNTNIRNIHAYRSPVEEYIKGRVGLSADAFNRLMLESKIRQGNLSTNDVKAYMGTVSKMGWINCDRFKNMDGQLAELKVLEADEAQMFVVFKNMNAILPMNRYQKMYSSNKIPVMNENAMLVSIKIVNGRPSLAAKSLEKVNGTPIKLQYKDCSMEDIKRLLNS